MNKRLKRHVLNCSCGIVMGDRGAGKSTLFAFIVRTYLDAGYEVYCQYPYKGCYQLPLVESYINGVQKFDVDKNWLYSANLSNACVLIDEARTVWPARGYAKWTVSDDEFFNFIRKNNTHLFLATQAVDALDLNIRRAADETYYMTPGFWHFSHIEASHTTLAKVADKNTEVLGRMFKKGMSKVSYDICEIPSGDFLFWRKTFYHDFISAHTFYEKPFKLVPKWDDVLDFDTLQKAQGYVEERTLKEVLHQAFHREADELADEPPEDEEEDENEPDIFLGTDLNDEKFELDLKPPKKESFLKKLRSRRTAKADTLELPELPQEEYK